MPKMHLLWCGMQMQRQILISEKAQAKLLGCSLRHLVNLRSKRLLPHVRLGRLVRYNPDAVQRAIEKLSVHEVA
jgi:excisionase family DNA binding protein